MDNKQVDHAMKHRLPVVYDGKRYDRILEFVSSYDENGNRRLSVGLLQGRTLHRVPADKVELAERG